LQHGEILVLRRMQMRRRLISMRQIRRIDLENLGVVAHDFQVLMCPDMQLTRHRPPPHYRHKAYVARREYAAISPIPWHPPVMADDARLTAKQFQESDGLVDWRVLAWGASAWFAAPSHAAGAALVGRIAELADQLPDVDLRSDGVHVRILRLTGAGAALAAEISAAGRELGLAADPSALQAVQLAFDVTDRSAVMPFWRTAMAYEKFGDEDLVDPLRRDPSIWFQQQDRPRPLRNRIHIDVSPPYSRTPEMAKVLGGPFGVAHADAEGNEADIIPMEPITADSDWRGPFVGTAFYPTASADFVAAVADLADQAEFPMLIDLRPDGVTVDTGKDQHEDERFPALARQIQEAARAIGLAADPNRVRFVQLGIDAVDIPAVRNFWRTVLDYEYDPRSQVTDIFDPHRLNMPFFFQEMPASEVDRREQRNRIHVDVFVPNDQAQARIERAVAAGGRVVYDAEAPEWWTLADPEGNEIDIAVSVGREELWQAKSQ
jgi:predicted enzyme related to lactoylglutathione lyase